MVNILRNLFTNLKYWIKNTHRSINDDTEVVDKVLAVEEVVGGQQEVPRQRTEPGQPVHPIYRVAYIDDFLEAFHLHA